MIAALEQFGIGISGDRLIPRLLKPFSPSSLSRTASAP
jgi:hypothetical protein